MEFDYFYNRDGDRFSYYMLPKIIVTDERFKNLSSDAKILYSCLLERTSLSFKNKWLDEENRVYIIFTVEEIMEILGRSNKTAVKILNELALRQDEDTQTFFKMRFSHKKKDIDNFVLPNVHRQRVVGQRHRLNQTFRPIFLQMFDKKFGIIEKDDRKARRKKLMFY